MNHASEFEYIAVIIGYLIIASQFVISTINVRSKKSKFALLTLVAIFVLCALCGYAPVISDIPDFAHDLLMKALMLATWCYIITNQAGAVVAGFERDEK